MEQSVQLQNTDAVIPAHITLTSGHMMCPKAYENKLQFLTACLKSAGMKVIEACRPYFGYDFTCLVAAPSSDIPRDTMEKFGRAGLQTKVEDFTEQCYAKPVESDMSTVPATDKTFIVRFKY
jgi:hypothetical protein